MSDDLHITATLARNPQILPSSGDLTIQVESILPMSSEKGRREISAITSDTRVIFVLFTNRSGSNLLIDSLKQLGFGRVSKYEPFLPNVIRSELAIGNFESFDEYLASRIEASCANGVSSLKVPWEGLLLLHQQGILSSFKQAPIVVWCRRRNKIEQAVSFVKARTTRSFRELIESPLSTGLWSNSWKTDELLIEIGRTLKAFYHGEAQISHLLYVLNLPPIEVFYEELAESFEATTRALFDSINLLLDPEEAHAAFKVPSPLSRKQATAEDQLIAEKFKKFFMHSVGW